MNLSIHQDRQRAYLPGLDGLRAIASLLVISHHIEQISSLNGLPNRWDNVFFGYIGSPAVSLFFVLSGFLITFLLLQELREFGQIDFIAFYKRRALRIFPLYYFIIFLGFAVIPFIKSFDVPTFPSTFGQYYLKNLIMYCLLCPQLAFVLIPPVSYAGALWSLGTEEWFYAAWPWIVDQFRSTLPLVCVIVVLMISLIRYLTQDAYPTTYYFFAFARFDCMAIGAFGACVASTLQSNWLSRFMFDLISRLDIQLAVYMALAFSLVLGYHFGLFEQPVFSVLFLIVIMNVSLNKQSIFKLESHLLKRLGQISFGLYLYNWIAIVSVVILTRHWFAFASQHAKANIVAFGGLGLTIVFASISYKYLETPFLRLKRPFEKKGDIDVSGSIANKSSSQRSHKPLPPV